MRYLKQPTLLEGRRRNLHADGQTGRWETATNADRRKPGHIERYGVSGQKVSRSIRKIDPFAVGLDIAAVTVLDGWGSAEQRRRDNCLHFLEGGIELLAEQAPDSLGCYVDGSGNQKSSDEPIK